MFKSKSTFPYRFNWDGDGTEMRVYQKLQGFIRESWNIPNTEPNRVVFLNGLN